MMYWNELVGWPSVEVSMTARTRTIGLSETMEMGWDLWNNGVGMGTVRGRKEGGRGLCVIIKSCHR